VDASVDIHTGVRAVALAHPATSVPDHATSGRA
jgi:hypothetical protein